MLIFHVMADTGRIPAVTKGRIDPGNAGRALHHTMIPILAAHAGSAPAA